MILVTGSAGLVGSALIARLERTGRAVRRFDLRDATPGDVRNPDQLATALKDVSGVVHLAAISRVVWAQRNAAATANTNIGAVDSLLRMAGTLAQRPWVIFVSSREVYGEPERLPVPETAPLAPLNIYGRSKVAGEDMAWRARDRGQITNVVRLSNVYGAVRDHGDRVVPAFARAAAEGGALHVEGSCNMFDFTHISDVAAGMETLVDATAVGELLPPVHFVTGVGTTLDQLADLAVANSGDRATRAERPARSYDVSRFIGDPARARELLGWQPQVDITTGFARLTADFRVAAEPLGEASGASRAGS